MEINLSEEHQTLKAREEEFRGKHVLVTGAEIYPIEDREQATQLLERLRKQHPGRIPLLAYVMKGEAVYPSLWKHYVHSKVRAGGYLRKQ